MVIVVLVIVVVVIVVVIVVVSFVAVVVVLLAEVAIVIKVMYVSLFIHLDTYITTIQCKIPGVYKTESLLIFSHSCL